MRPRTLATLLLGIGAAVGLGAAVALALGVEPPRLSPFMYKVVVYKLTFIAAVGLMVAGAAVRRWSRRDAASPGRSSPAGR